MKNSACFLVFLLLVGCKNKNDNSPLLLKEIEVRKADAGGLVVAVALVDANGKPTSAKGLLVVEIQGISSKDSVFTVAEVDTALTENSFRPLPFGEGSLKKKLLGFETNPILLPASTGGETYRKSGKKGLMLVSFKPEGGTVLQQTVTYED